MFGRSNKDDLKKPAGDLTVDVRLAKFFDAKMLVTKRAKALRKFCGMYIPYRHLASLTSSV